MFGKSLPVRIAVFSSLIGGLSVLVCAIVFGVIQKEQIENQVIAEGRQSAERFSSWTLGYFYQQGNLLHLETQQKFLAASPNVIYSYIVRENGVIDVGVDGVSSTDIGQKKQTWEKELPLAFDQTVAVSFDADTEMVKKYPKRVDVGDSVTLVGFPLSCPERSQACAQLRVALVPESAQAIVGQLNFTLILFGLLASMLTGLSVFFSAQQQVIPLVRIAELMRLAQQTDLSETDHVRASLVAGAEDETEEITTLKNSLKRYLLVLESSTAHEAIARSTQAFAHDVRKPFSMFKALIESIESTSNISEIRAILRSGLADISSAMASVDAMITDMMQIGNEGELSLDEADPGALIQASVREVSLIFPRSNVSFEYDLQHRHMVKVDTVRFSRVFSNILGNAFQAMNEQGEIYFKTRDVNDGIEFVVGNRGSYIEPNVIGRLFDVFYTSGKRGGTGLGLAIVKKIIERHGGTIRCISMRDDACPQGRVEFIFSVSCGREISGPANFHWVKNSSDVLKSFSNLTEGNPQSGVSPEDVSESSDQLVRKLTDLLARFPVKPVLVIADDEAVYRNSLLNMLRSFGPCASLLDVRVAATALDAEQLVARESPAVLIQDIDLGKNSDNGLELVKRARAAGFKGYICIHSNRLLVDESFEAMKAGADSVLPKPMSRIHLLQILDAGLQRAYSESMALEVQRQDENGSPEAGHFSDSQPRLAYVDDSSFLLFVMKNRFQKYADVSIFRSSQELWSTLSEGAKTPDYHLVLLDYYLTGDAAVTGVAVALELRARGYLGPIVLMSDVVLPQDELDSSLFAGQLPKTAEWWDVLKFLPTRASTPHHTAG